MQTFLVWRQFPESHEFLTAAVKCYDCMKVIDLKDAQPDMARRFFLCNDCVVRREADLYNGEDPH